MTIDTRKLLEALKQSNDKTVTMDKDFFINLVEELDNLSNTIKVEELFNPINRYTITDKNETIINSGELLSEYSKYYNLKGEVRVEAIELKALLKDNLIYKTSIQNLKKVNNQLTEQIKTMFSNIKYNNELKRIEYGCYNNNFNENIKVDIRG